MDGWATIRWWRHSGRMVVDQKPSLRSRLPKWVPEPSTPAMGLTNKGDTSRAFGRVNGAEMVLRFVPTE